jgi:hypothetical protein
LFSFLLPLMNLGKKMTGKGFNREERAFCFRRGRPQAPPLPGFFFLSFCNLLKVCYTSFSSPPFAYTEIDIYSARV